MSEEKVTDSIGQPIQIGDTVAYMVPTNSSNMRIGVIYSIANVMATMDRQYPLSDWEKQYKKENGPIKERQRFTGMVKLNQSQIDRMRENIGNALT